MPYVAAPFTAIAVPEAFATKNPGIAFAPLMATIKSLATAVPLAALSTERETISVAGFGEGMFGAVEIARDAAAPLASPIAWM